MPAAGSAHVEPAQGDLFAGSPYRAIGRLAAGGMGELFVVDHRDLGRTFVAKVLHAALADDPALLDRFRIEAQSLGRLSHPNIVSVAGFGTASDGRPYIVLEHLEGCALSEELESRGFLSVFEALSYARQLLAALSAAHALGIVHRDIKPSNLFLSANRSDGRTLKVLDFGIARILPDAPAAAPHQLSMPTDTGVVVGTPRFVSPEGAIGLRVDQRADIYAAGLVLYAMLVGRGPFDHVEGQQRVLSAHALEDPEPPSRFAQEPVPPELDRAVLRALAKDPAERFQTADEFKALLEQIQEMLNRPSGWLETSRFDPRALLEMPQREPVSEWTQPAPVSEAKAPPAAFSPARRAAPPVQVGGLERATGDTQGTQARPSRGLLVLLFVCVALLVGVVVAGLLALLRGHGP